MLARPTTSIISSMATRLWVISSTIGSGGLAVAYQKLGQRSFAYLSSLVNRVIVA